MHEGQTDDGGADATRSVGLDPSVLGENESVELLAEVLDHVVALGLSVDEEVEVNLLLEADDLLDLGLHSLLVLLSGDLALVELVTGNADLLGLGERSDGGGREAGELELLLLGLLADREGRLALEVILLDGGDAVADLRVRGGLELAAGGDRLLVGLEGSDVLAVGRVGGGVGEGSDLGDLLKGEREPVGLLLGETGLRGKGDRGVEERGRGGDDDALGTEGGDGLLHGLEGGGEVGLPDVAARDESERDRDGGLLEGGKGGVKLGSISALREVDVKGGDGELLDEVERLAEAAEVGSEDYLGGDLGELGVGGLELGTKGLGAVENKDGLIDLDVLGAGLLELGKELGVDGNDLVERLEGLVAAGGVTGGLGEGEEGNGSKNDGAGLDAESLGLLVLLEGLVVVKLELNRARDLGDNEVVVRVEPEERKTVSLRDYAAQTTASERCRRTTSSSPWPEGRHPWPAPGDHDPWLNGANKRPS